MPQNWNQFKDHKNNADILMKKAQALAPFILEGSIGIIDVFSDWIKDVKIPHSDDYIQSFNSNQFDISMLNLFMLMHITDRFSFGIFSKNLEFRDIFMDTLMIEIREQMSRTIPDGVRANFFREKFKNQYNLFNQKYGVFKWQAEKDEGLQNTLLWEYGKDLLNIVSPQSLDVLFITIISPIIMRFFKTLEVSNLLGTSQ